MTTPTARPFTAASFEQFLSEKKLMGTRCPHCNALFLPPRAICPRCHDDGLEWVELSGEGTLVAFTSIHIAPSIMLAEGYSRDNPYLVGVVELAEGVRISAQILGADAAHPETVEIGSPVRVEFIERGEGESKKTALAFRVLHSVPR